MTTEKKIAANRANAAKSTGPTSADGKARAAQNARKHGALALMPVLPTMERTEEWDAHRGGIMDALQPKGHLEEILAERIALQSWRLGRIVRYERDQIAASIETVEDDYEAGMRYSMDRGPNDPAHPHDVRGLLEFRRAYRGVLQDLPALPADRKMEGEDAASILYEVAKAAGDVDADELTFKGVTKETAIDEFDGWTAGLILEAVGTIATSAGMTREDLMCEALAAAERETATAEWKVQKMEAELRRRTNRRILPTGDTLEKLSRYESHLERSMFRALHELQRLQAARLGADVPAPAVLDVEVSPARPEGA